MTETSKPLPSSKLGRAWVRFWRRVYNPLGFKKGYNFPLFIILGGALMGFALSRMTFFNIDGVFLKTTTPGDAARWTAGSKRAGITMHLACILPAAVLVCFQFVPVIRYKFLLFHRMNGYVVLLLLLLSNISVYIIAPSAAGGHPATQLGVGMLATVTTLSSIFAYINIKRLQIDQHRAWMLRTWVYAGSIITLRVIYICAMSWMASHPEQRWYDVQSCANIWGQYALNGTSDGPGNPVPKRYPECRSANASVYVVVRADSKSGAPEEFSAVFNLTFGLSLWLAWLIHAVAVELYLWLTPAESERLRNVSYERQVEAGIRQPGRAGADAYHMVAARPGQTTKTFEEHTVAAADGELSVGE